MCGARLNLGENPLSFEALAELARAVNRFGNHKKAKKRGGPVVAGALAAFDVARQALSLLAMTGEDFQEEVKTKRLGAMGLSREDVHGKLDERAKAREERDWARADALRDELDAMGIVVMDRADGVDWRVNLQSATAAEPGE